MFKIFALVSVLSSGDIHALQSSQSYPSLDQCQLELSAAQTKLEGIFHKMFGLDADQFKVEVACAPAEVGG